MKISDTLLPEFDNEMANTRKTLERVPEGKLGWQPHQKSWPMANLATHVANLPSWATMTIQLDSLDISPDGKPPQKDMPVKSQKELLDKFDKNVMEARAAIVGASDEDLMKSWSLLATGKALITMPRVAILRNMVMNHLIHHRAQLTIYLRLIDVPVPALYGPSADEGSM